MSNTATHPALHRYLPLVRWSDEDCAYVGSCPPVIGDCCHGADPASVMRQLVGIIGEILNDVEADGQPLPAPTNKTYSGKLPLRIAPDLHRALAARAVAAGGSLNQYIERTLAAAIGPPAPRRRRSALTP